jgi:beta-glucosidase
VYERGCDIGEVPLWLQPQHLVADGTPGLAATFFANEDFLGEVVHRARYRDSRLVFLGAPGPAVPAASFSFRATSTFISPESGEHTFSMVQAGQARLVVNGQVVLDGVTDPPRRGHGIWGFGSAEITASVALVAGRPNELTIEYSSRGSKILTGVEIGCRVPVRPDLVERATEAARAADAVVLVVGTTDVQESEDHDRTSLELAGGQDGLVDAVLAANPNTVVVVNSGAPVAMDWVDQARCVLQAWFGGQEMGNAIADVITGKSEPAGRLPTTFPVRLEHTPSFGNFPGEGGQIRYGEGVLVGYRWYEARHLPTRFAFGHGLSYTDFTLGAPRLSSADFSAGETLTVEVPVTNTGTRRGAEVVQCYVAARQPRLVRPPKELKAFAKVWLDPGETVTVTIALDERAFAHWEPDEPDWEAVQEQVKASNPEVRRSLQPPVPPGWRIDAGPFEVEIGRSSADIAHRCPVTVTG